MLVVRLDRCESDYLKRLRRVIWVHIHENFGLFCRVDSFDILMMRVEKHDILR